MKEGNEHYGFEVWATSSLGCWAACFLILRWMAGALHEQDRGRLPSAPSVIRIILHHHHHLLLLYTLLHPLLFFLFLPLFTHTLSLLPVLFWVNLSEPRDPRPCMRYTVSDANLTPIIASFCLPTALGAKSRC